MVMVTKYDLLTWYCFSSAVVQTQHSEGQLVHPATQTYSKEHKPTAKNTNLQQRTHKPTAKNTNLQQRTQSAAVMHQRLFQLNEACNTLVMTSNFIQASAESASE